MLVSQPLVAYRHHIPDLGGLVKTRWTLSALACGALALGLLAPGAVGAAPSAEKPSGKAIVRIDGGTAYAKKKAKGSYRVVVPDGAQIDWMGEVTGKGVRSGSFTPKALVAGWVKMGNRSPALTTLTWTRSGSKSPDHASAYLSKPRVNSDGQLTFIAKTNYGDALPQTLPGFSINITRASTGTRSFTIYGPNVPIDGSTWAVGAATDVTKGYVDFWAGTTAPKTCRQSTPIVAGTTPATVSISSSFACGIYTVNTTTTDGAGSYLKLTPPGSKQTDQGNLFASFSVSAKGIQPFDIQWELARWQRDGTPIVPSCGPCS